MRAMGHWLSLEGIRFQCIIGVTERERRSPQDIIVNLQVKLDFAKAAASDSIHDTIDYRRLAECVTEAGSRSTVQLVESLATHLGRAIFERFPGVHAVRLEVEKPGALTAARKVKAIVSVRRRDA
jgi:dihydroneopterin aldolase